MLLLCQYFLFFSFLINQGGTNYNFMNGGSYIADLYLPITTSYDFDAPINEAGDPTEKYWQIQNVISRYNDIPSGPQPIATPKKAYGKYTVSNVSCLKL